MGKQERGAEDEQGEDEGDEEEEEEERLLGGKSMWIFVLYMLDVGQK